MKIIKQTEEQELQQIVNWFKMQYPQYANIFKVNYDRYEKDIHKAVLQKRLNVKIDGHPDTQLYLPRKDKAGRVYHGLFIEFKRTGITILTKKTKSVKKNKHIESQNAYLNKLNDLGYFAVFGLGFERTKEIIINYIKLEEVK